MPRGVIKSTVICERKQNRYNRLEETLKEATRLLIIRTKNVGAQQLHLLRQDLRGEAKMVLAKNTLLRKAILQIGNDNPALLDLLPFISGHCGLISLSKGTEFESIRSKIQARKVWRHAKVGAISPCDVVIPAGSTGLPPGKTSFFHALGLQTKICRGKIELQQSVKILTRGGRVQQSEAELLKLLDIQPFCFVLSISAVYDNGQIFDAAVLDVTSDTIVQKLRLGAARVVALGSALGRDMSFAKGLFTDPTIVGDATFVPNINPSDAGDSYGSDSPVEFNLWDSDSDSDASVGLDFGSDSDADIGFGLFDGSDSETEA
eukprot:TRINITY_DN562_c0_g1_i2.p1 TRINITY_DN562_c0_g1~~TRINITY_DN562_c0_g1_i2.p1  ORF type:complete len:319 (+),score=69.49 TRINITY_DN562_c0_g1_i2:148-1104(+)